MLARTRKREIRASIVVLPNLNLCPQQFPPALVHFFEVDVGNRNRFRFPAGGNNSIITALEQSRTIVIARGRLLLNYYRQLEIGNGPDFLRPLQRSGLTLAGCYSFLQKKKLLIFLWKINYNN